MRIGYITLTRFPTERAHGLQVAKVCDALCEIGNYVDVISPCTYTTVTESVTEYYRVSPKVRHVKLSHFDPWKFSFLPEVFKFHVGNALFFRALREHLTDSRYDLLYVRSPSLVLRVCEHAPTVLELHSLPSRGNKKFLSQCDACEKIVCLTSVMAQELKDRGVDPSKISVEADAVDLKEFEKPDASFRGRYELSEDAFVIGYAGQLRSMNLSKGVELLLGAAKILVEQQADFTLLIAGGPDDVRRELEESLPESLTDRVRFLGQLDRSEVPSMLASCDALVYPAPKSDHVFYRRDTSPLKIFEYMASKKPMICADLPPLRDIVDSDVACMFEPGNADALAMCVQNIITSPSEAQQRAERALERVQNQTWTKRMKRILDSLEQQ